MQGQITRMKLTLERMRRAMDEPGLLGSLIHSQLRQSGLRFAERGQDMASRYQRWVGYGPRRFDGRPK